MLVSQIVSQTIGLRRALRCAHEWQYFNATEDQCTKCGVLATEEGKKNLARLQGTPGVEGDHAPGLSARSRTRRQPEETSTCLDSGESGCHTSDGERLRCSPQVRCEAAPCRG